MDLSIRIHCVRESHAPVRSGSLDFCQAIPNLVLKVMCIMCWAYRAFEVFDDSDRDLAQFIEPRVFHRCDRFLVPWMRGIEPKLSWPDIQRPWSSRVVGYWVPPDTRVCLKSRQAKCSLVTRLMAWLLPHAKLCDLRFWMLIKSCLPPNLFSTKCLGCKML
jgi:hypothetical protein